MQQGKAMTAGREWKLILFFTLPIMAGNFLQQLYNAVDGLIVGNLVSEDALSAVGTCAPLTMVFIAIAIGMGTGGSIMISQYYGAGKMEELRRAVSTTILFHLGLGIGLSVVSIALARPLLSGVLAVKEPILADAIRYFVIFSAGLTFLFMYNTVAAILRALGDSLATLLFLLVSSVTNVVLDLLFVVAFRMGVAGVAIATIIAEAISAAVSLVYMFKRYTMLRFSRKEFRFHRDMGLLTLKLGVPTTLQQCVVSFGFVAIQRLINTFAITAAMTAATRVENFILIPIFGFNVGMATFTGQNIGAGKMDRVRRGIHATWCMSGLAAVCLGIVAFLFCGYFARAFGLQEENVAVAMQYLRFMSVFMWVFALHMATAATLQGAGDVVFTAFATVSSLVMRCVATYLLAFLVPQGVVEAVGGMIGWAYDLNFLKAVLSISIGLAFGWSYNLVLSLCRYKWGPWRRKGIIKAEEETP